MYVCESWTIKKAENQTIDAFELWCWRRFLRVPWTARKTNQSILRKSVLNIHRKDWCWSWNSNTLAIWCKELTHWKRPCCWKRLKTGGEGDNRGCDGWMASLTQWTWVWVNSGSWWTRRPGMLQSMGSQRVGHDWVTGLNWSQDNFWKFNMKFVSTTSCLPLRNHISFCYRTEQALLAGSLSLGRVTTYCWGSGGQALKLKLNSVSMCF